MTRVERKTVIEVPIDGVANDCTDRKVMDAALVDVLERLDRAESTILFQISDDLRESMVSCNQRQI
jgi:hypothetical protein